MPRATAELVEIMRREGYLPLVDAARLTGHAATTLYDWVHQGKLRGLRTGHFHFVEIASLKSCAPQVKLADTNNSPEAA